MNKIYETIRSLWERVRSVLKNARKVVANRAAIVAAHYPQASAYAITGWAFVSSWVQVAFNEWKLPTAIISAGSVGWGFLEFIAHLVFISSGFVAAFMSGLHVFLMTGAFASVLYVVFIMAYTLLTELDAIIYLLKQRAMVLKDKLADVVNRQKPVEEVSEAEAAEYKKSPADLLAEAEDLLGSLDGLATSL